LQGEIETVHRSWNLTRADWATLGRVSGSRTVAPSPVLVVPVTDADGLMHLVTDAAMSLGRGAGRYRAMCGANVLTASLTTPERGYCRSCREARRG
jgi:hypothetical protein